MSDITFNEKVQVVAPSEVSVLETFEGRPYKQMTRLLATGRAPLHMKGFMERRLEDQERKVGTSKDAKTLRDNYFTSANLMVRNSKGGVVIASYENNQFAQQVVSSLNENSVIKNGSLVEYNGMNSDELYDAVKEGGNHVVISANKVMSLNNDRYEEPRIRNNVWRNSFAEGDEQLSKDYGALVDKITDTTFKKNRGLWLPGYEGGRLVWLGSVGHGSSDADGGILDYDGGRLVRVGDGVASAGGANARDTSIVTPTLEQTLAIVTNRDFSENEKVRQMTDLYKQ